MRVWVEGRIVLNSTALILTAALGGFGLACLPETLVRAHLDRGTLIRVPGAWRVPFSGDPLHSASHRQGPPARAVPVEALRWTGAP